MGVYRIQKVLWLLSGCILLIFTGCGGETPQTQPMPVLPKAKAVESKPPTVPGEVQEGKAPNLASQE